MKTHEVLTKIKEKLGKYESLCMIEMENFERIENLKKNAILSDRSFGKHRIIRSLPNQNPDENKLSLPNLNLEEGI